MTKLQKFLARYAQSSAASEELRALRRKHRAKVFDAGRKTPRPEPSPIGATPEEIRAWAKAAVARREAKKKC